MKETGEPISAGRVPVDDIEMYFEVHGQGEPLLMIMGLGGHSLDWGWIVPQRLAESYRVILFDNRGAGRSDQPPGPLTIGQMAKDAAGLLDASGRFNASAAPKRIAPSEESARNLLYTIVPAAESGTGADITISEHDVMNLMRAKAAIYSACSLMLRSVGLDFAAIDRVYVAGGFGRFLDLRRAIVIGMLPDLPLETYVYLGNSALAGAHALLTSHSARETITGVADRMTYLELNVDPAYMDEYTAALFIPHTDQARFPSVKR